MLPRRLTPLLIDLSVSFSVALSLKFVSLTPVCVDAQSGNKNIDNDRQFCVVLVGSWIFRRCMELAFESSDACAWNCVHVIQMQELRAWNYLHVHRMCIDLEESFAAFF